MKRDFTESAKNQFIELVAETHKEEWVSSGFLDWLDDLLTSDVKRSWENLEEYRKKMIDKNNFSQKKIDEIWGKIKEIDRMYAERFFALNELAIALIKKLELINEKIRPEMIINTLQGSSPILKDEMSFASEEINNKRIQYYDKRIAVKNNAGEIIDYDWDKLREMDAEQICEVITGIEGKKLTDLGITEQNRNDKAKILEKIKDCKMKDAISSIRSEKKYSYEVWKESNLEERKSILEDYMNEIVNIYGITVKSEINFYYKKPEGAVTSLGYYTHKGIIFDKKEVSINEYIVESEEERNYENIMDTVQHELRHGYQHNAVDDSEKYIVSKETRDIWKDNFDNYKTVEKDGFDDYYDQPVEVDARSFEE